MTRANITFISGLLAVAAVLGTVAANRTVHLGAARTGTADAALTARVSQLDAYAVSLRRALAARPPALLAIPKPHVVATSPAVRAPAAQVVYRRPAPIVVVKHTHRGDDAGERADGGGGGDD